MQMARLWNAKTSRPLECRSVTQSPKFMWRTASGWSKRINASALARLMCSALMEGNRSADKAAKAFRSDEREGRLRV